ncbi:MAG TPA: NAD-dependent malic enzyme, partial [Microcoleaceae bacterium UBA10368]|nr:NAD-dependent malic enzyme [Microcoleaceae cyanobacterium UBA10368]
MTVKLTPNPSFSLMIRVSLPNQPGMLASVTSAIASVGGNFDQIELIEQNRATTIRDITVDASSIEHSEE